MWRPVRMAAVVALIAASAPFARADAAPSPARWRLWRVTRISTAPRPVGLNVSVTPAAPKALALVVRVGGTGSHQRIATAQFWEDGGSDRELYRDGAATALCVGAPCPTEAAGRVEFRSGTDQPVRDVFFILTWGATATTSFDKHRPGWVTREVAAPRARRVLAAAAGATGVVAGGRAVEHFTGATAAGGRHGSIAWAGLPCDLGGHGQAQVAATAGGTGSRASLDCDITSSTPSDHAAVVAHAASWSVTGSAIGAAGVAPRTRLLVLDLPA